MYDPYKAEARVQKLKQDRSKRTKLEISPGLKEFVINMIKEDWSTEQISETLRQKAKGKCVISTETIYQFIFSDEGKQLKLWIHLRHKKKPQRQSWSERRKYKARIQIPDRHHISLRSPAAKLRTEYGHFDADLMIFSHTKKILAVFVDRYSRQTYAFINPDKTASAMKDTLREFVTTVGSGLVNLFLSIIALRIFTIMKFMMSLVLLTLSFVIHTVPGKKEPWRTLISSSDSTFIEIFLMKI